MRISRKQADIDEMARNSESPVPWWRMTAEEQIRQQTGPGTEGLPGFVVDETDLNPWFFDDESGEWKQWKNAEE